jgi:hypothetical protein
MAINLNDEHPDDELIEDARMAASTDWEESFCRSILDRRQRHGANFNLSERERSKLIEISSERE